MIDKLIFLCDSICDLNRVIKVQKQIVDLLTVDQNISPCNKAYMHTNIPLYMQSFTNKINLFR